MWRFVVFMIGNFIRKGKGAPSLALSRDANAIGLLRLIFALLVIVCHSWPVGMFDVAKAPGLQSRIYEMLHLESVGAISVGGFFFFSGILITQSYERSKTLADYLLKRFRRIYPGYLACLLVTVFAIAPAAFWAQHGTLAGYWAGKGDGPLGYLVHNLGLAQIQGHIRDVFAYSPYSGGINGSLWTLRHEAKCYLLVAVLGMCGVFRKYPAAVFGLIAFFLLGRVEYDFILKIPVLRGLFFMSGGWEQATFFAVGMAAYLYRDRIRLSHAGFVVALLLLLTANFSFGPLVTPFAFSYVFYYLAAVLPGRRVGGSMDLSYGVYLYGCVVEQMVTLFGGNRFGIFPYMAIGLVCVLPLAWLSWTYVEAPAFGIFKAKKKVRLPKPVEVPA